jgi:hypothetical protein
MLKIILNQAKAEIKQLPLLLAKLLGGIMAVIGFPAVVFIATRKVNPSLPDVLPCLFLGVLGVFIFAGSSRALAKRTSCMAVQTPATKDTLRISIIAWAILLLLSAIFLVSIFILTR